VLLCSRKGCLKQCSRFATGWLFADLRSDLRSGFGKSLRRPLNLDIALLSARTPWLLCPSLCVHSPTWPPSACEKHGSKFLGAVHRSLGAHVTATCTTSFVFTSTTKTAYSVLSAKLCSAAEQVLDETGHQRSGSEGLSDRRPNRAQGAPDSNLKTGSKDGEHERNLA